ncbi:flagellar biosynthetic protein FliO [Undibacterium sp. TJN19]|uniref:flagellar biosynthetic protein FliO n=1 Tax=Undibacterium sp. TJN19 TaxID=3413055 RepID=UPI003BF0B277
MSALIIFSQSSYAQVSASGAHTSIPFKQDKQPSDSMAYQGLAGALLAGLAAYGVILGLKRYRDKFSVNPKTARRLRTLEAIRLGKTSMLYVIEYNGQELLLAESAKGIQLLTAAQLANVQESAVNNA